MLLTHKRVMYNDFILVGPKENPAGVSGDDINAAFKKLSDAKANFVSRGDDSGTHKKELGIWTAANIQPAGEWYISTGQGMGANITSCQQRKKAIF